MRSISGVAARARFVKLQARALACAAIVLAVACEPSSPASSRPSIVVIVIDTARADHFSAYGYPKPTTPHLESFAEESILFERAYSTSCWTVPAHASLFTGLYPATHRATQEEARLGVEFETLAELLGGSGYRTALFTGNPWLSPRTGLSQGFDEVTPMWTPDALPQGEGLPHPTNVAIFQWLESAEAARPSFLFVNYIEPHWPYEAPRAYQDRFVAPEVPARARKQSGFTTMNWYLDPTRYSRELQALRTALYDAEIAFVDAAVGELVEGLKRRGVWHESLVVVTSDHGENLGDHGHQGHSFSLHDSAVRVPLLLRLPNGEAGGTVRTDPVQLVDLFATIAAAARVKPSDPRVAGRDLLAGPVEPERPILSEYYYPKSYLSRFPGARSLDPALDPYKRRLRSLRIGPDKLIWGSDGRHELYDLDADPQELDDRAAAEPERLRALEARLEARLSRFSDVPPSR